MIEGFRDRDRSTIYTQALEYRGGFQQRPRSRKPTTFKDVDLACRSDVCSWVSCRFTKYVPHWCALMCLDLTTDLDVLHTKHRNKRQLFHSNKTVTRSQQRFSPLQTSTEDRDIAAQSKVAEYIKVPGLNEIIRPTVTDRARTITHVCTSGTLCTTSVMDEVQGSPFGSYVDYILDDSGWPVMLLSEQSLHTMNIKKSPQVSLFCQLPRSQSAQAAAALSRVTIVGTVEPIPAEQLSPIKLAFTLTHQYAEQIADSPKFSFCRIKPQKIYFSGGFGVMATWVDVLDYETARPDVLAAEVTTMLSRINLEKQGELLLLCKHFLNIEDVDIVRIQAIDRLGVDLRVKAGDYTDEYRVGFRNSVNSAEDAKSEVMKLFQECWERDNGFFFTDDMPPTTNYAQDILRNK